MSLLLRRPTVVPALDNTTRALDLGAVLGGGLSLRAGPGRVALDARYTHGLLDVQPDVDLARTLNRSVTLTAGYSVRVRR